MGLNLSEIPQILGISKAMLFSYRNGKNRITNKVWIKLDQAEGKLEPLKPPESTPSVIADSSVNLNDSQIGETPHSLREDPVNFSTEKTTLEESEIEVAFRKLREGLDLLEQLFKIQRKP